MAAPPLKDDLSFSPNPKMVGQRNPDSVLFKIQELTEPDESRPPARGKNEVIEEPAEPLAPPARELVTPEQQQAGSSGLVNVQDLLHQETEAANAVPKEAINPGLIPETPPPVASPTVPDPVAPPAKMPTAMLVAGGVAMLIAAAAVFTALT